MTWGNSWPASKPASVGMDLAKPNSDLTILTIPMKGDWPRQVSARIIGDLAIHEHLGDKEFIQITHVPTLARFVVPEGASEEQLINWCSEVQKKLPGDWATLRRLTPLTYMDESANDAKSRIKAMCEDLKI